MNSQCDVYAYEHNGGGVSIHVAGVRHVLPEGFPEDPAERLMKKEITTTQYVHFNREHRDQMANCEVRPIGLSRDGQGFNLPHDEAADLIESLRAEGYNIPEGVEDAIRSDAQQEGGEDD